MKLFLSLVLIFSTVSFSQAAENVSKSSTELVSKSSLDGKKSRRHKKMNKKRKRSCAKWSKKSFAG